MSRVPGALQLLLIKKLDTLPVALWEEGFLTYRHRIVGIHAPKTAIAELKKLYNFILINREFFRFFSVLHNTESAKATANRKQDIDLLPCPNSLDEAEFVFWEIALKEDTLKYMTDYVRRGQNSMLLRKAAGPADLNTYSELFLRMLGSVYENLKAAMPVFLDGLICQPFYFGEQPKLSWIEKGIETDLRKLIYHEEQYKSLRTIRILRFYSHNVIVIVKPDRLRYWIHSTAIRDADETLTDLREQGY